MEARNKLASIATWIAAMALSDLDSAQSPNKPEDAQKHIEDARVWLRQLLDLGQEAALELGGQV
jgi:hypothetical protein